MAPSLPVAGVSVNVTGNSSKFDAMIQRVVAKLNSLPGAALAAGDSLNTLAKRFERAQAAGNKFQALGSSMAGVGASFAAVGAAAAFMGKAIVSNAADVESSLANASAIAGKTQSGYTAAFDTMREATIRFAAETKYSTREVADAFVKLSMSGMSANTSVAAMPAVLRLAAASGMDLADSANAVVGVMAGFGLGTDKLADANNVLVAAFTGSNTTLGELAEGFKYAGPVAHATGVSIEETAAALGLLANANLKASMGGTGLRRVLSSIAGPTNVAAKALKKLGISGEMLQEKGLRGVVEQLQTVRKKMDDAGQGIKFVDLAVTAFGDRGGTAMVAMADQGVEAFDKLYASIEQGKDTNIAAFIEAKQLDTFSGALEMMTSNVESLALSIGQSLMPFIRALVEKVTALIGFVNGLNPNLQAAIGIVVTLGTALAVVVGILGAMAAAIGMAIPGVVALGTAIGATTLTMAEFTAILGVGAIALTAFVVAYNLTAKAIDLAGLGTKLETGMFSVFGTAVDDATTSLKGFLTVLINVLSTWLKMMTLGIPELFGASPSEAVRAELQAYVDGMEETTKAATGGGGVADALKGVADAGEGMTTGLNNGLDETEAKFKAAQKAALAFAEALRDTNTERERLTISTEGAKGIFDLGESFRRDVSKQQATAFAARGADGGASMRQMPEYMEKRQQQFLLELRDKLEAVPFNEFAQAMDQAHQELEGLFTENEITAFFDLVKRQAPENLTAYSSTSDIAMKQKAAQDALRAASWSAADALRALKDSTKATGRSIGDILSRGVNGKDGIGAFIGKGIALATGKARSDEERDAERANTGSAIDQMISGGVNVGSLGNMLGGIIGSAFTGVGTVAGAAAGQAIGGALQGVFDSLRAGLEVLISDSRALDSIFAGLGAVMGLAIVAVGALIASLFVGLGLLGIGFALVAVVLGPLVAAFAVLSTHTKSYARMQGAMSVVVDKAIAALEPLWMAGMPLVGLFYAMVGVLTPFMTAFAQSVLPFRLVFETVKAVAVVLGAMAYVAAGAYDALLYLTAAFAYAAAFILTLGDMEAAQQAFDSTMGESDINLDDLAQALGALAQMTWEGADSIGEFNGRLWDAAQETDDAGGDLADSIRNAPEGLRVEAYRDAAQNPGGGGPGRNIDATPGGMIEVHGDLVVNTNSDIAADEIADVVFGEGATRAAQQNGNPGLDRAITPRPKRPRRRGRGTNRR